MEQRQEQLVLDKITIPATPPRVSRARLIEVLSNNLNSCTTTIINGRTGTGKTTLMANFARYADRPVSWYKVDATDSELRVFMEYLFESLSLQRRAINPDLLLRLIHYPSNDRAALLAESLVFQLGEGNAEPLLVVIEDLHLVYDADWVVPFFYRLLSLLPAEVHVLITCRSMPPTPLWRMRSKQTLRVIDEPELAFTVDETIEWFKSKGLDERRARFAWVQTNGRSGALADFIDRAGSSGTASREFHPHVGVLA
jgi:LuxR family maltose regulon positive regulatory protein